MNPEVVGICVEVDQGRVLERRFVALKFSLKVEGQDDADRQDRDQQQVADHVTLKPEN